MIETKISLDRATDWGKARVVLKVGLTMGPVVQKAILAELNYLRKQVVLAFENEGPAAMKWKPLNPITLAVRRFKGFEGTKILQVTRDLVGSVAVIPMPGEGGFVGVARSKSRKGGRNPLNIAQIQEEGYEGRRAFTAKQRRFLFAAMRAAGLDRPAAGTGPAKTTVQIRIPPRPFLGPTFERYARPEDLQASIMARVAKLLGGAMGTTGTSPRE